MMGGGGGPAPAPSPPTLPQMLSGFNLQHLALPAIILSANFYVYLLSCLDGL